MEESNFDVQNQPLEGGNENVEGNAVVENDNQSVDYAGYFDNISTLATQYQQVAQPQQPQYSQPQQNVGNEGMINRDENGVVSFDFGMSKEELFDKWDESPETVLNQFGNKLLNQVQETFGKNSVTPDYVKQQFETYQQEHARRQEAADIENRIINDLKSDGLYLDPMQFNLIRNQAATTGDKAYEMYITEIQNTLMQGQPLDKNRIPLGENGRPLEFKDFLVDYSKNIAKKMSSHVNQPVNRNFVQRTVNKVYTGGQQPGQNMNDSQDWHKIIPNDAKGLAEYIKQRGY